MKDLNLCIHDPVVSVLDFAANLLPILVKLQPQKRRLESDKHKNFSVLGGSASEVENYKTLVVTGIKFVFVILLLSQSKQDLTDLSKIR